ncbi:MAG TPA: hypothetical protein VJ840_11075 [Gemmatimonadaceae bacterium]|nr:hypothetical protein [Gemmatimonadaceae bacterium]
MINRIALAPSILCLLYTVAAPCQTHPGLAFDEIVHETSGLSTSTDTNSAVLHFTTSRGNIRVDVEGRLPDTRNVPTGRNRSVMLMTDSGSKLTFINDEEKQYMSLNPGAMAEAVKKMMESMGGTITVDTAATKLRLDSLGPGPTVDGHPTLRYRLLTTLRMTIAMMGNSMTMEQESVDEIQAATDFPDFNDLTASLTRLGNIGQTMGFAPEFIERARDLQKRIRGLPIRITRVQIVTSEGRTRRSATDMVVSNVRRLQVPDSLFQIPTGYTPVAMPKIPSVNQ